MDDEAREARFGLVMPFVACRSRGGPHDDASFAAGYRLGRLDERLSTRMHGTLTETIAAGDVRQADLIAMRHGYLLRILSTRDTWAQGEFVRIPMAEPATPG